VEVSRIQGQPVASTEDKIILVPGVACIRPPSINYGSVLAEGVDARFRQRQQ
jgi:hypothetical protein